jgi:hypothetical protein
MYIDDNDVGYVLNPGFKGYIERSEFKIPISINQNGLRGKNFSQKNDSIYRILILGDSQTFGFGVKEDKTFAVYLEKCLNEGNFKKYEVLNAGVPGYGTADQLNFLKSIGPQSKPDLVILQFLSDNDIHENLNPAKRSVYVKDGWLVTRDGSDFFDESPFWRKWEHWLKSNFHSAKFLSERIGYLILKSGLMGGDIKKDFWGENFSKEEEKLLEMNLVEMFNFTKKIDSKFVVLFTTGQGQVLSEKDPDLNSEKLMKGIIIKQNIEWINVFRIIRENDERTTFYYPIDGHWKPAGHRFVAEVLCNKILNKLLNKEIL